MHILNRYKQPKAASSWNEDGVSFANGIESVEIAWCEIESVFAYKKDCLTVDQIRVVIVGGGWQVEFTEDEKDFDGLRLILDKKLHVLPGWYESLVAAPAFELTWTHIYSVEAATMNGVAQ